MMAPATSLRARLLILILVPLILVAILVGYWRYTVARATAEQIFDRTLVALTLAIARDVAISGGDALSPASRDLMREVSDGEVFYHVHGPDGVFVTGYAYPPRASSSAGGEAGVPHLFEADYRGEPVRASRLTERTSVDGISGFSTVTVWQRLYERQSFARWLGIYAGIVMATLIITVAAVVWFGINLGLKPLQDLQHAIASRSSDDLTIIRRAVPREVDGLVSTLNSLFRQVTQSIASRDRFISDAAHQLRNPIAGLKTLAEAAGAAKSAEDARLRAAELAEAAQRTSRLTQQLLSYERIGGGTERASFEKTNLNELAGAVCMRNAEVILAKGLEFSFEEYPEPLFVQCDAVLLSEALENVIHNALVHGGAANTGITVSVKREAGDAVLTVRDWGAGIREQDRSAVFERFAQSGAGEGSGLGLSIVKEIVRLHDGVVSLNEPATGPGLEVTISFRAVCGN